MAMGPCGSLVLGICWVPSEAEGHDGHRLGMGKYPDGMATWWLPGQAFSISLSMGSIDWDGHYTPLVADGIAWCRTSA